MAPPALLARPRSFNAPNARSACLAPWGQSGHPCIAAFSLVVSMAKFIGKCRTPRQVIHQLLAGRPKNILSYSICYEWLDNRPGRQVRRETAPERRFGPVVAYSQ